MMLENSGQNTLFFSLTEEIKQAKKKVGLCVEDFLTATYAILLAHYLNKDQIVIDLYHKYSNRFKRNIIKVNVNFDLTFGDFIKCFSKTVITNGQLPDEIINAMVIFSGKSGLKAGPLPMLDDTGAPMGKTLSFEVDVLNFNQKISWVSGVYSEQRVAALNSHIKKILTTIIEGPDIKLKDFTLLTPAEFNKITLDWNLTEAPYPSNHSIPDLFKKIVDDYPGSTALNFKGKKLTYLKLDQLSTNVAHYITNQLSFNKHEIIGLYMERSPESFICLLGILKSGLAYLPIHLYFPPERIQMVVDDAEVKTLFTQGTLLPKLHALKNVDIVSVDAISKNNYGNSSHLKKILSDDIAYIIYTSGTTGKPKGIQITHKSVCNLTTHVKNDFRVTHGTRVLQFASLGFDASVYEWAGGLLNGAELFILSEEELPPGGDLAKFMKENKINFALLPPPILETMDSQNLDSLHTLISGGEACTENIVQKWADGRQVFNAYGPSEATVACSYSRCFPKQEITIGKPIQNVKVYILNKYNQPVPIGVPGELCIGGVGLAKGYLNRDDLTKKLFIQNAFSKGKAERIYKTGDLARWLENGEVQYISRIDTQVKIEGYRIELSEVEWALNQYREIESSCVIANKIDQVHKQLIAFYTLKNGIKELDNRSLNVFLGKTLPKYMIPTRYVKLSSFPLTPSNKVDRTALLGKYESPSHKISPENSHAEIGPALEKTWRELLNCTDVSGNFFSLGGDSIKAIQCVAILRKYGHHITSKTLYDHPTIDELVSLLKNKPGAGIALDGASSIAKGKVSLSPIQHWFFEHQFKNYNAWNQAFLFKLKDPINAEFFHKAWRILMQHHAAFRLRYDLMGNKVKQYYTKLIESNIYIYKDINIPNNKKAEWITKQCLKLQNALNIQNGPVCAIGVFNNHNDGHQRILLAIHHLIIDGVSWRILLEDLCSVYNQLLHSQEAELQVNSDHYGKWVKALEEYGRKRETKLQIPYWNTIVQKNTQERALKKYNIGAQNHWAIDLSKDITSGLLKDLPNYYPLAVNDILLAGLAYTLYEDTKGDAFVVDLEGHGREECVEGVDVTRTLGWFTTIFPILLKIPSTFQKSAQASWGDLLLAIKKELRQVPDKGIGFGVLNYMSKKKRIENATALVLFNYLGQFDLPAQFQGGWAFAPESPGNPMGTDYSGKGNYSRYPLEINAVSIQGALTINFNYNKHLYSEFRIKKMAHRYKIAIEKFVALGRQLALGDLYLSSETEINNLAQRKSNKNGDQKPYKPFSLVNVNSYKNVLEDLSLIEDIYPASCFQQRMLVEAAHDPNGTYHIISNFAVNAKLDKKKLIGIFEDLTSKHELLRASFLKDVHGKYSVVIYKSAPIDFHFLKNQDSKRLIDEEKRYYFNYSRPGLFRILVNNKGPNFDLIFSIHNALEDGWSMATLVNEFSQAYINNKSIKLPLELSYGEYIRNEIASIGNQSNISFWKRYLRGFKPITIPWGPGVQNSATRLYSSFISLPMAESLVIQQVSKEIKITVDTVFLLAYIKTLADFTKTSDITIGVSTHNRLEKEGGDKLFGSFINIIPFRFDLKKYSSTVDRLTGIFLDKIKLQKYKTLPYDYIKSFYNKELYTFAFDFVHMHNLAERAEGIASVAGYERTHIPLTLTIVQNGEGLFLLGINAHDDFVGPASLDKFTQSLKKNLSGVILSIEPKAGKPAQMDPIKNAKTLSSH